MNAKQLDEIMRAMTGMEYSEWKEIEQRIELLFIAKRNKLSFTPEMAEETKARLMAERDQIFKG